MSYHVVFSQSGKKDLKKLDQYTQIILVKWLRNNLEGCEDPRIHGKPLSANRKGQWRYRVGDYRILVVIHDNIITIEVIAIGHRRNVYDS